MFAYVMKPEYSKFHLEDSRSFALSRCVFVKRQLDAQKRQALHCKDRSDLCQRSNCIIVTYCRVARREREQFIGGKSLLCNMRVIGDEGGGEFKKSNAGSGPKSIVLAKTSVAFLLMRKSQ